MYRTTLIIAFSVLCFTTSAQKIYSYEELTTNRSRTNTNMRLFYGAAGLANIGLGIAAVTGSFVIDHPYYGIGNMVFGSAELAYAIGRSATRREDNSSIESAYKNYTNDLDRANLRIYRDLAFMALGTAGALFSKNEVVGGIGVSLAQQGIILIIIDGIVYASHNQYMGKWGELLRSVTVTGNTVGLTFRF